MTPDQVGELVHDFLQAHDPVTEDARKFLRARFDAGLAWIACPPGCGGLGLPQVRHLR
jgi:hypothetical protein